MIDTDTEDVMDSDLVGVKDERNDTEAVAVVDTRVIDGVTLS